ncbi:hypothetical protein [Symmachiella macrocystis]|uniref:hypothetical protein n=1 Tax=Symmachiella macrocystis TaxID=2527985 RepID=UPI0011B5C462|nr:hypothetical protein [Symmachiella macrocystis]
MLRVVIVAGLLLVAGEAASRVALKPVGTLWEYWNPEAAVKFRWYRDVCESSTADDVHMPDILVVGDSTAARDFDPVELESQIAPGYEVYNLGWPANFPMAFQSSTIPMLRDGQRVPSVVVASFSPSAFADDATVHRFEANILHSAYCRRQREGTLIQDFLWMTRIRPALRWQKLWFSGKQPGPPPRKGFYPLDGHEEKSELGGHRDELRLSENRLDVLRELVELSSERNFQLVIVIPPIQNVDAIPEVTEFRRALETICKTENCHVVDCLNVEGGSQKYFWNVTHLNQDGAKVFSRWFSKNVLRDVLPPAP